ncbi:DUF6328 family protein [Anaeromyxobacter paludicola]|uniref:Integral membrane protein n=1 Tax=Anaeromyxobacter paludicola TaxID=2918171 RepID=A0ABM7XG32_9BACT|nr:DUF6328 family protein [Anaeromyxobacter paludicola]BDG10857.1 hypothetical protein AMPC_39700 [Anaeromyxobacter paludicola]
MAALSHKVQNAMDEARILILGTQILIGFGYRSFFEPGFERLLPLEQALKFASLCLLLCAFCLLVLPAAHHRLVEGGNDTPGVHRFTTRVLDLALAPFALALGLEVAVALAPLSRAARLPGGILAGATAAGFWYALTLGVRLRRPHPVTEEPVKPTPLDEKIQHVLTEARMVLPGAQALLGFQFAVSLMDSFDELPPAVRWLHVGNLGCIALSVVLLMTPAAWHRIVERGEETEHFHRIASRLVLAAMVPLAFGISGDLFVVAWRASEALAPSLAAAGAALVTFLGAWFGLTLALRARQERSPAGMRAPA